MNILLRTRMAFAAALASLPFLRQAVAQDYPSRPVSLTVGFAAGGSADTLGRLVAQKLSLALNQPVVVDNRPGAGGTIAAAAVAAAKPDGHTLLLVTSGHAGSAALYPKLGYDPAKAFAPVIKLSSTPVIVVTHAASPYKSLRDIITMAKKAPGKLNYAAGGGGATVTSLAAAVLQHDTGIEMVQINYKGSGPALTALLAGEVDLGFDIPSSALPHIKAGRLRALAVTSRTRSAGLPGVPTVAEEAAPHFEVTGWFGVLAPAGTPTPILARLNRDIDAILAQPDVKERLTDLGMEPVGGTAAEFGRLIELETRRTGDTIRRLGLRAD